MKRFPQIIVGEGVKFQNGKVESVEDGVNCRNVTKNENIKSLSSLKYQDMLPKSFGRSMVMLELFLDGRSLKLDINKRF